MSQAPPSPRRQGRPPVYWPDTSADLFSQPPATPAPGPPLPSHPEDEFFARGNEEGTLAPSSFDDGEMDVDEPAPTPPSPAQLRRRARLRRLVSGLIGTVSIAMTLAGVRAFFARSRARRPVDNAFTVRQQVVPSIETGTPAPVQNLTGRCASTDSTWPDARRHRRSPRSTRHRSKRCRDVLASRSRPARDGTVARVGGGVRALRRRSQKRSEERVSRAAQPLAQYDPGIMAPKRPRASPGNRGPSDAQ